MNVEFWWLLLIGLGLTVRGGFVTNWPQSRWGDQEAEWEMLLRQGSSADQLFYRQLMRWRERFRQLAMLGITTAFVLCGLSMAAMISNHMPMANVWLWLMVAAFDLTCLTEPFWLLLEYYCLRKRVTK